MHACMRVNVMYVGARMYMQHSCICICMCAHVCICICAHVCICSIHELVCACVRTYVNVYVRVYHNIHTKNTFAQAQRVWGNKAALELWCQQSLEDFTANEIFIESEAAKKLIRDTHFTVQVRPYFIPSFTVKFPVVFSCKGLTQVLHVDNLSCSLIRNRSWV